MRAFIHSKYGRPEVLYQDELPIPEPADDEVIVRTRALSINPAEWHTLNGKIILIRLAGGFFKPREKILGADIAGIITAKGASATGLEIGDRVYGRTESNGIAEYAKIKALSVTNLPGSVSMNDAAATPLGALTALQALRNYGKIQKNEHILINGASGGIGTFAVQLAHYYGAIVTAITSTRNVELVKKLGASEVIDYLNTDVATIESKFDVVIDLVGNLTYQNISFLLAENGRSVMVGFSGLGKILSYLFNSMFRSKFTRKTFSIMNTETNQNDLNYIAQLMENGEIKAVIDREYDFDSIPEAFQYLGTRRARGKIVVTLSA